MTKTEMMLKWWSENLVEFRDNFAIVNTVRMDNSKEYRIKLKDQRAQLIILQAGQSVEKDIIEKLYDEYNP